MNANGGKGDVATSYRIIDVLAKGWLIVGIVGGILGFSVFPILTAIGVLR